jgi:hypothetical protein
MIFSQKKASTTEQNFCAQLMCYVIARDHFNILVISLMLRWSFQVRLSLSLIRMCVYTSNPTMRFLRVFVVRAERDTQELDVVYINLSILGFYANEHPAFFFLLGKPLRDFLRFLPSDIFSISDNILSQFVKTKPP